jgi:serine/threonine protein kinase
MAEFFLAVSSSLGPRGGSLGFFDFCWSDGSFIPSRGDRWRPGDRNTMAEDLTHTSAPLGDTAAGPIVTSLSPPGFELEDEIRRGRMGFVYRARNTALDRDVAGKLLSERYPQDSVPAQRFLSDARITGQLQHLGVPAVHQVGAREERRRWIRPGCYVV